MKTNASYYDSPLGRITLAGDETGLRGLWFEGQKYYAPGFELDFSEELPVFEETKAWLDAYFAGKQPNSAMLRLNPMGSEFRRQVWKCLLDIPYGQTTTYGEIARRIAEKTGRTSMSAQAVGGAVGHNPISVIIPCHRVLGSDGKLTGYAGGIWRKTALLTLEGLTVGRS